ncbi:sensor domain-containing diguanylate cyclase [Pseudomarimonas arenosa]|uniref:diguanylate cyclase n=1 Tax=Pseudomarimonas arenosa TaxID=2774145 RepID=A0AAW3ZPD0_9GAMM|nr:sensor domain-containing diguanylate cyclase [Pseudomarimonas arenosa]MBD8526196.1 diguanylate cyclase [Pseudomarimonas arenosa]
MAKSTPSTPRSPRTPALLLLSGLLLLSLLVQLGVAWWARADQRISVEQSAVLQDALWVRGELHAMAAAETLWLTQGVADPLVRAQRKGTELLSTAERLLVRFEQGSAQSGHAKQLLALVQESTERAQEVLSDARQAGPSSGTLAMGHGLIAARLDRLDSVINALQSGAQSELRALDERAASRFLISAAAGLASLIIASLMLALLYFEARSRARAEHEQGRLAALTEQAERRAQKREQDIQRLAELGDQLRPAKSIEDIAEVLGATMRNVFAQFDGALYLQAPSRNVVRRQVGWGKPNPPLEDLFTPEDCWAMRRGVCYPTEPHSPPCRHLAEGTNPKHVICAPLMATGEIMGVLHLSGSMLPDLHERRIAQALADQLGLAVANLRLQENLRVQSVRDMATGLYNRRYIESALLRECLRARRSQQTLAIILIDLDRFKDFNERHSHEAGDAALGQIGSILNQTIRPEDLAGRYSGEKFMVLMPEADLSTAMDRAELLRRAVRSTPIDLHGRRVEALTCSIGLALFPLHGSEPALCLRATERALAEAKKDGRDRIVSAEDEGAGKVAQS